MGSTSFINNTQDVQTRFGSSNKIFHTYSQDTGISYNHTDDLISQRKSDSIYTQGSENSTEHDSNTVIYSHSQNSSCTVGSTNSQRPSDTRSDTNDKNSVSHTDTIPYDNSSNDPLYDALEKAINE